MKKWNTLIFMFLCIAQTLLAYDVISNVHYPLSSRPAMVEKNNQFTILWKADADLGQNYNAWSVDIYNDFAEYKNLEITSLEYRNGYEQVRVRVPANAYWELYSLRVSYNGTVDEVSNAVKVLAQTKTSYYMVHLPDMHMPSVYWRNNTVPYEDKNTVIEVLAVFDELAIINPEFVIQTGDIVDNGLREEQYQIAQKTFTNLDVPVFITAGNHDVWYEGHDNWKKYINPIMDYSFDYGKHHYAGMEMYEEPIVTFSADQMQWLQEDLRRSNNRGNTMTNLFYHYDVSQQIDASFVDQYGVDLIMFGHSHQNIVSSIGSKNAPLLNTSQTMDNQGQFRLINISNNSVDNYPTVSFKNLSVDYTPANDGHHDKVVATIQNKNNVDFPDGLIKFLVKSGGSYFIQGGSLLQKIPTGKGYDVYYVSVDISANRTHNVSIVRSDASANFPPQITKLSHEKYPLIIAGKPFEFGILATDQDEDPLTFEWELDGQKINGANAKTYTYTAPASFVGIVQLTARVKDNKDSYDEFTWTIDVTEFSDKPIVQIPYAEFFPQNVETTIKWVGRDMPNARFEFGLTPDNYTGSINVTTGKSITFTPEDVDMSVGFNYCRITDGEVSSKQFIMMIESPQAPVMQAPIGTTNDLAPIFTWETVPGVPYYVIMCSEEEIIINEDENGEFTVEGANPIWMALTSENSIPYGTPDESGTYQSSPPPLVPGHDYYWIVFNCYADNVEYVSAVQSGISKFTIDVTPPDFQAPALITPHNGATLKDDVITFRWNAVNGASSYHFYPYKVQIESGIETALALWDDIIAISSKKTSYDYNAKDLINPGEYRWKVSAVSESGLELPSDGWDFVYDAPSANLTLRTYDNQNTPNDPTDDASLARVSIKYSAINGVQSTFPLSTDLHGIRSNFKLTPGTYVFRAEKQGYDAIVDTVEIKVDENKVLRFRLSPATSTITGKVVDNAENLISDAKVTATHSLLENIIFTTTTNSLGAFNLPVVGGPYQIFAQKSGFEKSAIASFSVESGQVAKLPNNLVLVRNTNTITGTVLNSKQQPVYGATVTLKKDQTVFEKNTDANGFFKFVVANGTWSLSVKKQGFISPTPKSITASGGSNIVVSPSPVLSPNASIITGQVTDGTKSLTDVSVKAFPSSGSPIETATDNNGQFSLNVTAGTYSLVALKENYTFNDNIQVTIQSGETKSGVDIVLSAVKSKIKGKVTIDGFTPLEGVLVSNSGVKATTSAGGSYELGVEPGTHTVTAFKEKYISTTAETLTVVPGQVVQNVNFVLSPNASVIKGKVKSVNGPVFNATVRGVNSTKIVTKTDENGNYVLNVEAGTWNIEVEKTGFIKTDLKNIQIGVGQELIDVDFNLTINTMTISGTVMSGDNAVKNATINIVENDLSTLTDDNGDFALTVEKGEYLVEVTKPGYKPETVTVSQTNNTAEIDLEKLESAFTGTINDQAGKPLKDVILVTNNNAYQTKTDANGSYQLDVKAGTYTITAQKTGFKTATLGSNLAISGGQKVELTTTNLELDRINIHGTITNSETDLPIVSAKVIAQSQTGFSAQIISDENGNYQFKDMDGNLLLIPGTYTISAQKAKHQSATQTGITLNSGEQQKVDFTLKENTGFFTGTVKDNISVNIAQATVTALDTTTKILYKTLSFEDGTFELTGLPAGLYKLSVAKAGYSSPVPVYHNAGLNDILFTLKENKGKLSGLVTDAESSEPVSGVKIVINDGFGNVNNKSTSESGMYEFTQMPQDNPYTLTASKTGYSTFTQTGLALTENTSQNIIFERFYGDISGTISDENGQPVNQAIVKIKSYETIQYDTTGTDGIYKFTHLPSDQYSLSAYKPGYIGDPVEQIVGLWTEAVVPPVNFTMIEAMASDLKIIGPEQISNQATQQYIFSAKTADLREASILPIWSIDFRPSVDDLDETGLLDPKNDFIGEIVLFVKDSLTQASDSIAVSVTQNVFPGTGTFQVSNYQGAHLELADSTVDQNIIIQLRKPQLANVRRQNQKFSVIGDVYEFSPKSILFKQPIKLTLPILTMESLGETFMGYWDAEWLEWVEVDGAVKIDDNTLQATINQLGRYAVLEKAEPLGLKDIEITPNPFSPELGPVSIKYKLTSNETTAPEVTIKIYNMIGDLVKTVANSELQERGNQIMTWDGITDYGNKALNGRYVLHIKVKDVSGEKEKLETFVLIK